MNLAVSQSGTGRLCIQILWTKDKTEVPKKEKLCCSSAVVAACCLFLERRLDFWLPEALCRPDGPILAAWCLILLLVRQDQPNIAPGIILASLGIGLGCSANGSIYE